MGDEVKGQYSQRERYLTALLEVQRQLLAANTEDGYAAVLQLLGEVSDASRVYVFENEFDPDRLVVSQRIEWCAPGITSQIDNVMMQQEVIADYFPDWVPLILQGKPIQTFTTDLPACGRKFLEAQDIQALLVIPIVAEGKFLGILGFDRCTKAQLWEAEEIELLQSAAAAIVLWTERERTAVQLQESELLFRSIFENSAVAIGLNQPDGTTLVNNAASLSSLGYTAEEMQSMSFGDYTYPDDLAAELGLYKELLTGKRESYQIEKRYIRKDQQLVWARLTVSAVRDSAGKTLLTFAMSEDITEQRQVEADLRERVRLAALTADISIASTEGSTLQDMLERCAEALLKHLDVAFSRIWTVNASTQALELQASKGLYTHLNGMHSRIRIGEYKIERIAQARQPLLTNDILSDPHIHDKAWAKREGMVAFAGYPLIVEDRVVGVVAVFAQQPLPETTLQEMGSIVNQIALGIERKQSEEVLRQALEAAKVANRAKSQFLSHMSHELRTPLNVILGFTQLLARGQLLTPQQQNYIDTINRSGEHLLVLINDVLEMSKIEAGQLVLNETEFDLCHLLDWLFQMLRLKAETKHLAFNVECAEAVPRCIRADRGKLLQVLMNLLGNAIKFTDDGSVVLQVEGGEHWKPDQSKPIRLKFEVVDTGIGIAPEDLHRLFEPFIQTQAEQANPEISQEGTGLGLAISQRFVRLMGGEISVSSQVGQGSVFRFSLPVQPVAPHRVRCDRQQRVVKLAPHQPVYRILVVEDNADNRRFLVELLTPVGFAVQEAANGAEAIERWRNWSPHLIWMDIQMPVMDGYTATRQIKATPQPPIIIALTGSAFEEDRVVAMSIGCDDFVRKPVAAHVIFEKLTQYLGVQYLYTPPWQEANPPVGKRNSAQPPSTAGMPHEWIRQLHQAAVRVNAKQVQTLIKQIPTEQSHLIQYLNDLVQHFQFEKIVALAEAVEGEKND